MFREDKATAMACFFLERATNHELNDIKLMKLLYIAERESLQQYAMPVTNDAYVSMQHGPVLSKTYRLLRDEVDGKVWDAHVSHLKKFCDGGDQTVELVAPISYREVLRECEIDILESVWSRFGDWDKWDLKDYCHENFGEYDERAAKLNASIPIDLATIFSALGDSDEDAHEKAEEIRELASL